MNSLTALRPPTLFFGATTAPLRYDKGEWEALEDEGDDPRIRPETLGRVWYPWSSKRTIEIADANTAKAWGKIIDEDRYDEKRRDAWVKEFHARMKREHLDAVAKFEDDWWGAATPDEAFKRYFALHFDESDPNTPNKPHCPGLTYTREAALATTPAPQTTGQVLSDYASALSDDPAKPSAVMLRALAANQKEIIALLGPVVAIEQGGAYAHESRNDKLFDLGVGLVRQMEPGGHVQVRYAWLGPALGDLFGGYSLMVAQGLSGAASALAAKSGQAFLSSEAGKKLLARAQGMALVQRATDLAVLSISAGAKPGLRVPLQITKRYPAGQGIYLLSMRGTHTRTQAAGLIREGHIEITLLTDNHELAGHGGDAGKVIEQRGGRVSTPAKPTAALLTSAEAVRRVKLTEKEFSLLWRAGQSRFAKAPQAVSEFIGQNKAVMTTLDGRLALGGLLLNGLQLGASFGQINDAREEVRRAAWFGLVDGATGVLGGAAGVVEVVLKARLVAQGGEQAIAKSVTVQTLRVAGNAMGVATGVLNMSLNWMKAADASAAEEVWVARLYRGSFFAFAGTAGTFLIGTIGALADRMVAKGVARAVAIRLAARFGAQGIMATAVSG